MALAILLFAIGVTLVIVELIVPSFGLITLCALVCFGFSVYCAHEAAGPGTAFAMGAIAPVITIVILYFGLKVISRAGFVLEHPSDQGEEGEPTVSETAQSIPEGGTEEQTLAALVGSVGVAHSDLRPVGIVLIDGKRVDCVTEGAMIDAGARVKVVQVEGNRVVVRQVRV